MNDDFHRKVEIFKLMHKLKLCHFIVKDSGGHGSVSLLTLPDGVVDFIYKVRRGSEL